MLSASTSFPFTASRKPAGAERLLGGDAVGGDGRVSDGDPLDGRVHDGAHSEDVRIDPGRGRHPEHQPPGGVREGGAAGQAGLVDPRREGAVGAEEDVEGRALLDLGEERAGGAEGGRHLHPRIAPLEGPGELLEDEAQVGGGRHRDLADRRLGGPAGGGSGQGGRRAERGDGPEEEPHLASRRHVHVEEGPFRAEAARAARGPAAPSSPSDGQTGDGMTPSWNVTLPTRMHPFIPGRQKAPSTFRQRPSASYWQLQELKVRDMMRGRANPRNRGFANPPGSGRLQGGCRRRTPEEA